MGCKLDKLLKNGDVFHRLTVVRESGRDKHGKSLYECVCACGNNITTAAVYLRAGDTKSCGCLAKENRVKSRKKHGLSRKKNTYYETWKAIKSRCYNKNNIHYKNYGGRGIVVCDRWLSDFNLFLSDMGEKPSKNHSIDRIDVNGGYSPENCRWATSHEQTRNKRSNRCFEFMGLSLILEDWSLIFKIHQSTLVEKLRKKDFSEIVSFYLSKKPETLNEIVKKIKQSQ